MKNLELEKKLKAVWQVSQKLKTASTQKKNQALRKIAESLIKHQELILTANQQDIREFEKLQSKHQNLPCSFRDRLLLNKQRIIQVAESVKAVTHLEDPVGEIVEERKLENKLNVKKVRSPLGVIFLIFEARPNVAVEAFSLAFKAGNAIILKGGRESARTAAVLYQLIEKACYSTGLPKDILWGISDIDRTITQYLLTQKQYIDVVVPRGGEGLIQFVSKHSVIPVLKNDRGLCHIYVHADADAEIAFQIITNAKTQRPGVCNAMETLLVHKRTASRFLPLLYAKLEPYGVQWKVCPASYKVLKNYDRVEKAADSAWDTEYLDLIMNCKIVGSIDEAIQHIQRHGSRHSEAIITKSKKTANIFQSEVDAAAVYWNASTRFTDGYELGLGGELGISTQKLHVRGPIGLKELTTIRWVISGQGQVRK